MLFLKGDGDIITAPITPTGVGAISVIRVSGPNCFEKIKKLFLPAPNILKSHSVFLCYVVDPLNSEKIDQILLTYFKDGTSFTGEETVEISCHGSTVIVSQILELLGFCGVRLAERGEFTYRAFMNGKLDLTQAEGMLQLINSKSSNTRKQALRHLDGQLSHELSQLENSITWCLAHIEAGIDFSHEPITVADNKIILDRLHGIISDLEIFANQADKGKILREGLNVLLVGEPNVGKSSLLNFLSKTDRALVSELPGTTRDFIDCRIHLSGHVINLIDSAGIHKTDSLIELAGIVKTQKLVVSSDLVVIVFDLSKDPTTWDLSFLENIDLSKCLILLNKTDQKPFSLDNPVEFLKEFICKKFKLSTTDILFENRILQTNTVIAAERERILELISEYLIKLGLNDENVVLTQRQSDAFNKTLEIVKRVASELQLGSGSELIAFDLKEGLVVIQQLLGKHFDDQVLDKVFKEFCLGK